MKVIHLRRADSRAELDVFDSGSRDAAGKDQFGGSFDDARSGEGALYGSSKAALVLLTKSWAAEFGPAGVRVNAVSPGPTRTEGTDPMGETLDALAAGGPAGPDDPKRLQLLSLSWPPTSPVSFTAPCCPLTAAVSPSDA